MYQNLFNSSTLYPVLLKLDEKIAAEARDRGCRCGGKLHRAFYPRKPRGASPEIETDKVYRQRQSFCCALEGCRKRTTPPSVLFLGRRVYFGAVVSLVSVLRQGVNPTRLKRLRDLVGVSARTVRRWRQWWLNSFVRSRCWQATRGRLRAPLDESALPLSLLESFETEQEELRLVLLLHLVSPLTTTSAAESHAF